MIPVRLLVKILERHGFRNVETGKASLWVFVSEEREEIFPFEEWQAPN